MTARLQPDGHQGHCWSAVTIFKITLRARLGNPTYAAWHASLAGSSRANVQDTAGLDRQFRHWSAALSYLMLKRGCGEVICGRP